MDEATVVISISAGIVALIALLIWSHKRQIARRRADMESVAQQAGWTFDPHDAPVETLGTAAFPLFKHGRARLARNVMRASDFTASTMVFDYRYTVGSGKNQRTVEGNGDQLLVYRTSKRVEQQDVRAFREDALSIARHLDR